jgi:fatty acid desaturase
MLEQALGRAGKPSRAVSLALSACLVILWGVLRLAVFKGFIFPLSYALPLLICIWTRDKIALWGMALVFVLFAVVKQFWILPEEALPLSEEVATGVASLLTIIVGGTVVHLVISLRNSLEAALAEVQASAEQIQRQNAGLQSQSEELAQQAEELTQ